MKKLFLSFLFSAVLPLSLCAQFSAGTDGFHIEAATPVNLNGLTLTPTPGSLTLTNKSLSVSSIPVIGSPTSSIKRVYSFSGPVNFTGNLGIFYLPDSPASELNGNTEANLAISYSSAGAGSFVVTTGSTPVPSNNYVSYNVVNKDLFSITAVNGNSALPVSLLSFTVRKEGQAALLSWATTSEINSSLFEIQHSQNAKTWEVIGQRAAVGNSTEIHNYTYTDPNPVGRGFYGNHFYRLKMIDSATATQEWDAQDKSFAYSTIRDIFFDDGIQTTLYPNPTSDKIRIQTDDWSKVKNIQITNLLGVVVYDSRNQKFSGTMPAEIDVKSLPSGSYLVKINRIEGFVHALKVVRQ